MSDLVPSDTKEKVRERMRRYRARRSNGMGAKSARKTPHSSNPVTDKPTRFRNRVSKDAPDGDAYPVTLPGALLARVPSGEDRDIQTACRKCGRTLRSGSVAEAHILKWHTDFTLPVLLLEDEEPAKEPGHYRDGMTWGQYSEALPSPAGGICLGDGGEHERRPV